MWHVCTKMGGLHILTFPPGTVGIPLSPHRQTVRMAASKTLMDFLQPPKRLKVSPSISSTTSSSSDSSPKRLILPVSSLSPSQSQDTQQTPPSSASSPLTAHQKSRIEFNKCLAKFKRNLTICSQKVSKSKGTPYLGFAFAGYLECD